MKKSKNQKNEQIQEQKVKPEKKLKSKKKKKDPSKEGQRFEQSKSNSILKSNLIIEQKEQCKISEKMLASQSIDTIGLQLQNLHFDGNLLPNTEVCSQINHKLQQLTINLLDIMIMKPALIKSAIKLAKRSLLTPKQYFTLDYTNKLIVIRNLLKQNSLRQSKYGQFIKMIENQVDRVEQMVLRSIEDVRIYEEVFADLRKNNVEWESKDDPDL